MPFETILANKLTTNYLGHNYAFFIVYNLIKFLVSFNSICLSDEDRSFCFTFPHTFKKYSIFFIKS